MNIFNYWDNGTWENEISNVETNGNYSIVKSNDESFNGSYSGKATYIQPEPILANVPFRIAVITASPPSTPRGFNIVAGSKYTIKAKIFIPNSNPIGSDDVRIGFMFSVQQFIDGTDPSYRIGDIKGVWTEITATRSEARDLSGLSYILLATHAELGGVLNPGGVVYIDDVVFIEEKQCDLVYDSPQFTKTNETVDGANNGSITALASSTYTIEYTIDNITWQLSNVFSDLAPGIYNLLIRDSNPEGCGNIISNDIIIQPGTIVPPPVVPSDDLVVDLKPVNDNNFLSWFATTGDLGYTNFVCSNQCWDIPNAYLNNKIKQPHYTIITPDETTSFYLNFSGVFNDPNHADLKLGMINLEGVQKIDVSDLNILFEEDGLAYDIWSDVNIPAMPNGIYRFIIYNVADNSILFVSQEVQLMNSDYECVSTYIQFRNSLNLKGFRYQLIANFIQQFRMRLYEIDEQSEGDIAQYRSVSSGLLRNVHYDLDRYIVLESYYFDKLGHRAMSTFQVHDSLFVNGVNYLLKTAYKSEANVQRNTTRGTLELFEQDFSSSDKFGVPIDLVVVGSDDDLLVGDNGGFIKL